MFKKLLNTVVAVAAILVLATTFVSAAEYLNQDFEDGIDVFMSNTPPEGAERIEVAEEGNTVVMFKNATGNALVNRVKANAENLPKGGMMMFDYKNGAKVDNGYVYVEFHRGLMDGVMPKCTYHITSTPHEDDVWYTYIITMNEDCTSSQIYRKKRDTDDPFVYVQDATTPTNGESSPMWRMYNVKHDCYFDNIRIFSGIFAENPTFELDGAEISELSEIGSGTLTAKTNIICGQVTKEEAEDGGYVAKGADATPMMVFFDKNMRMINCTQSAVVLNAGDTEISVEVDTSAFAHRLEGGYAGLYVLDDMMNIRPLSDAVELK